MNVLGVAVYIKWLSRGTLFRVVCEFDWELDELEEFVDKLIEDEALAAEQKDEFKEYVKEQVRAAKKANREVNSNQTKMDDIYIYIYIYIYIEWNCLLTE
ncbi:hypothetical protein YC2023_021020 [Brassica napus]